jgi:hypothetical protein
VRAGAVSRRQPELLVTPTVALPRVQSSFAPQKLLTRVQQRPPGRERSMTIRLTWELPV